MIYVPVYWAGAPLEGAPEEGGGWKNAVFVTDHYS